ncbi:class I SAM-dependent methyltransferase [bacterium]|nr:class I SAM-dependent methyltransferase [bacterium]
MADRKKPKPKKRVSSNQSARKRAKSKKRVPARVSAKKKARSAYFSRNVPQIENLLSEIEYGESIAEYFDILYPEEVLTRVQAAFYEMIIKKYNVKSACDLACRTGQTLKLLHKLGIKKLAGVDVSPAMIARCKKKLPKSIPLFINDVYLAPMSVGELKYDLVICTKDSLPMVLDDEALLNFFAQARELLTDKGVLIVEMWNYEKIWRNKERFMPVMDRCTKKDSRLFFLENDFHQELLVRNLIHLDKNKHEWTLRALSIPARPVTRNEVEFFVKEAQFSKWGFLGSYGGGPYVPHESMYTILIATK